MGFCDWKLMFAKDTSTLNEFIFRFKFKATFVWNYIFWSTLNLGPNCVSWEIMTNLIMIRESSERWWESITSDISEFECRGGIVNKVANVKYNWNIGRWKILKVKGKFLRFYIQKLSKLLQTCIDKNSDYLRKKYVFNL